MVRAARHPPHARAGGQRHGRAAPGRRVGAVVVEGGARPSWPYESSPAVKRRPSEPRKAECAAPHASWVIGGPSRSAATPSGRCSTRRPPSPAPELAGGALAPRVDEALARRGERVRAARRHVEHHLLREALDRRRRRQVGGAADAELAVAAGAPRYSAPDAVTASAWRQPAAIVRTGRPPKARRQRQRRVDARREPARQPEAARRVAARVDGARRRQREREALARRDGGDAVVLERAQRRGSSTSHDARAPPAATAPLAARDASPSWPCVGRPQQ